jgi:hypothetical protein
MKPPEILFASALHLLNGAECWLITGGDGTGAALALHFGDRVQRARWLDNRAVSTESRQHEGEFILYVECPWRFESRERVMGSWLDAQQGGTVMMARLRDLEGQTVSRCSLEKPANDLSIEFAGGYVLRLFCDQTDPDVGDNFTLFTPQHAFSNRGGFAFTVTPRNRR